MDMVILLEIMELLYTQMKNPRSFSPHLVAGGAIAITP
jgi:hypothetical protein